MECLKDERVRKWFGGLAFTNTAGVTSPTVKEADSRVFLVPGRVDLKVGVYLLVLILCMPMKAERNHTDDQEDQNFHALVIVIGQPALTGCTPNCNRPVFLFHGTRGFHELFAHAFLACALRVG